MRAIAEVGDDSMLIAYEMVAARRFDQVPGDEISDCSRLVAGRLVVGNDLELLVGPGGRKVLLSDVTHATKPTEGV